jgi:hypothetical protein
MSCEGTAGFGASVIFGDLSFGMAEFLSGYGSHDKPVPTCCAKICCHWDTPMLRQGHNMLIDRIGDYSTNGYEAAHVFGLRGDNCIGYIIQADGNKIAAVWHSKDGTRINGPVDENLARFGHPPKRGKA